MPRWDASEKYKNAKAAKSIELYSLNHSDFVKARISLRDQIETARLEAKRYFARLEDGDADHESAYAGAIKRLRSLQSREAPHSGFCASILKIHRHEPYLEGAFI